MKNHLEANGIEIRPFRPHAMLFKVMNEIVVLTMDISTVTTWHGLLHIEHITSHKSSLVGFKIVNAKSFKGKFILLILLQALLRDLKNQSEHKKRLSYVMKIYSKVIWLSLLTPATWRAEG